LAHLFTQLGVMAEYIFGDITQKVFLTTLVGCRRPNGFQGGEDALFAIG
jgi:hypothetical protein